MTSPKQIEANQANAKRSTGPKSQLGKNLSRTNSWKHGLTAQAIAVHGEDPDQLDILRTELEEWRPSQGIESHLIDLLATLMWRLRRVPIFEARLLEAQRAKIVEAAKPDVQGQEIIEIRRVFVSGADERANLDGLKEREAALRQREEELDRREKEGVWARGDASDQSEPARNDIGAALLQNGLSLGKLSRYETGLLNRIAKTLQLLFLLQSRRDDAKNTDRI